jgi:4-amino-4-deoxy-L-arabinose transferase-like glycosyltransferase
MKNKLILLVIILFGFGLRVWQVGKLPAILNRDEAAIAYNAYLLKETHQDEWGRSWPLTLESFGDFKLPGYPMLVTGLFYFFELNDLVVRLPSVLAGTALIWLAYLWGKKIFDQPEHALLGAAMIAVTPVFFFYSRIAFEANVALTLLVGALYCLFLIKPSGKFDALGLILIALANFTYNTPFLLLPFITILLILSRGLKQWQKWLAPVLGLISIFLIFSIIFVPLTSQKKGITIFNDETTWNNYIQYRSSFTSLWLQKTVGNRWVYNVELAGKRLIDTFSYRFLVSQGGSHPWHALPGKGHIYLLNYLLGWLGLVVLFISLAKIISQRETAKSITPIKPDMVMGILLFVSLLPSIVTVDSPHATRSLLFFYLFIILGIRNWELINHYLIKRLKLSHSLTFILIILMLFIESSLYLYRYFSYYPDHQPASLKVGLKETVQEVEQKYPDHQIAYVDGQGYDYILVAWYNKTSATDFFQSINKQLPDKIGFRYGDRLTHYHFIADSKDRAESETILVEWDGLKWSIKEF